MQPNQYFSINDYGNEKLGKGIASNDNTGSF